MSSSTNPPQPSDRDVASTHENVLRYFQNPQPTYHYVQGNTPSLPTQGAQFQSRPGIEQQVAPSTVPQLPGPSADEQMAHHQGPPIYPPRPQLPGTSADVKMVYHQGPPIYTPGPQLPGSSAHGLGTQTMLPTPYLHGPQSLGSYAYPPGAQRMVPSPHLPRPITYLPMLQFPGMPTNVLRAHQAAPSAHLHISGAPVDDLSDQHASAPHQSYPNHMP